MIVGLYALAFQTIFNYILGYFSDKVSFASLNVANIVYDMNWFKFSVEEQKLILIMIQRAQTQFHFRGNDSIVCSLHTFLKVTSFVGIIFLLNDSIILNKCLKFYFPDCQIGFFLLRVFQNDKTFSGQVTHS